MGLLLLYCMGVTELYQMDEEYSIDREEKEWWIFGEYQKIEIIFQLWQIYIEL